MLRHLQWMICHLAVFKCTLFAYPTQSACLGSTWLYLYFAFLSIQEYFLPSVLLTGSVIEIKRILVIQFRNSRKDDYSSASSFPFLSLIAAAILAEHKDCHKRGQCIRQMEKVLTVNVEPAGEPPSVLTPTQPLGGRACTQRWPPYAADTLLAGTGTSSKLAIWLSQQPAMGPDHSQLSQPLPWAPAVIIAVPVASKPTSATGMASAVCWVLKGHSGFSNA